MAGIISWNRDKGSVSFMKSQRLGVIGVYLAKCGNKSDRWSHIFSIHSGDHWVNVWVHKLLNSRSWNKWHYTTEGLIQNTAMDKNTPWNKHIRTIIKKYNLNHDIITNLSKNQMKHRIKIIIKKPMLRKSSHRETKKIKTTRTKYT